MRRLSNTTILELNKVQCTINAVDGHTLTQKYSNNMCLHYSTQRGDRDQFVVCMFTYTHTHTHTHTHSHTYTLTHTHTSMYM